MYAVTGMYPEPVAISIANHSHQLLTADNFGLMLTATGSMLWHFMQYQSDYKYENALSIFSLLCGVLDKGRNILPLFSPQHLSKHIVWWTAALKKAPCIIFALRTTLPQKLERKGDSEKMIEVENGGFTEILNGRYRNMYFLCLPFDEMLLKLDEFIVIK